MAGRGQQGQRLLIDRAAQKSGRSYSGIAGFAMQDSGVQELMGPIVDSSKENLVSCDNGIIMARHHGMRAAKALVEKGETPPGVARPSISACARRRSCSRPTPCIRTRRKRR